MSANTYTFGTAGIRAIMGPLAGQFNAQLVERTTDALCQYLLREISDAPDRGVCVGFDARHHSAEFAAIAAEVINSRGIAVHAFSEPVPTPLLAFSVKHTKACAGIMITASHNPAAYNGYKLYWHNGVQIIPPYDAAVLAELDSPPQQTEGVMHEMPEKPGLLHSLDDALPAAYITYVSDLVATPRPPVSLRIAYSPLHGVGRDLFSRALAATGFDAPFIVPNQAEPDPDFPGLPFPNPEEPGVMDNVIGLGREKEADLALVHDPDADRLAVAIPDTHGHWRSLTGNEVGALLGDYLLGRASRKCQPLVLSTIVSSPMLGEIAAAYGARWEQTLTGFKWLMTRALALVAEGYEFIFAYEEALGYAVSEGVSDKDGISAAIVLLEYAGSLKAQGSSLFQALESLWRKHGVHWSVLRSITLSNRTSTLELYRTLESLKSSPPRDWAGTKILSCRDYQNSIHTRADGTRAPIDMPPSNVVAFDLEGQSRVVLRPSGTEPKLKIYVDVREPLDEHAGMAGTVSSASKRAEEIMRSTLDYLAR
ncbi:MAG: phospho-sugar mutase [Myxococcales bacterium]|nr:phospho-sugar mutase [Myxococcales bacterium]MCB9709252.1 phospho-sugar mutase [Myxococcales bacterium]